MAAKYILAALALVFLASGATRLSRHRGTHDLQGRIWVRLGLLFGAVSAWLFFAH